MADELKNAWNENPKFNEYFDQNFSKENIAVANCKHLPPSELLFTLSPDAYEETVADWKNEKLRVALGGDDLPKHIYIQNDSRFSELIAIVRRKRIVPFVGAGFSKPCGYPTWHECLTIFADHTKEKEKISALIQSGELIEAADILSHVLEPQLFDEMTDRIFGPCDEIVGPVKYLPDIAATCLITTNFDDTVKRAFEAVQKSFDKIICGKSHSHFHRALANGERQLLMVHGQIKDPDTRIFSRSEYDVAYGHPNFNYDNPLPDILSRIFRNQCMLFLGCSLANDRTMSLFREITLKDTDRRLPRHYAVVEATDDLKALPEHEVRLSQHQIFPIWFAQEQYQRVEELMAILADEFYQ